jgi:hypothetical protein
VAIAAHRSEVSLPSSRTGEAQDLACPDPPDEILERAFDGARIRTFAAQAQGLVEQAFVKHKIRAFHAHNVQIRRPRRQAP